MQRMRRSHTSLTGLTGLTGPTGLTRFSGVAAMVLGFTVYWGAPSLLSAQPRGGILRGTIVNGTTGGPGSGEKVTLFRLSSGMEPIKTAENVSGTFVLENIEIAGEAPYLLQVTYQGVNYNQPVSFGRGYEAEASFTVYDATDDWKDVTITTARFLLRRKNEQLRVDKLFVVENKTSPPKTLFDPEGTFRFFIPPDVVELRSVSATSSSGMPVPQPASPDPDGRGFFTRTAFKPGATDFTVSYDVPYSDTEGYEFRDTAFFPLAEAMILVAPADIELEAEGWENKGRDPDGRFVVLYRSNVAAGTPLEVDLSGGSEVAADLIPSSSMGGMGGMGGKGGEGGGETQSSGARITVLPDGTSAQKWIIITLMAAALVYGLLAALVPTPSSGDPGATKTDPNNSLRPFREALARLEAQHATGQISAKRYKKEKRELQARLARGGKH